MWKIWYRFVWVVRGSEERDHLRLCGVETITGLVLAGLLIFLSVEKVIDKEQAEIKVHRESNRGYENV